MRMNAPSHHFNYESSTTRPANATIDYKIVLTPIVGRATALAREELNAIVSFVSIREIVNELL